MILAWASPFNIIHYLYIFHLGHIYALFMFVTDVYIISTICKQDTRSPQNITSNQRFCYVHVPVSISF